MAKLKVCKSGHTRKAYKRKSGVRVKASRVSPTCYYAEDLGAKGRGKKLFTVKKGLLSKYGYSTELTASKRHVALRKADKAYGTTRLFRMLQAQVIFRKREQPDVRRKFEQDRNWVKRNFLSKIEALGMTRKARMAKK